MNTIISETKNTAEVIAKEKQLFDSIYNLTLLNLIYVFYNRRSILQLTSFVFFAIVAATIFVPIKSNGSIIALFALIMPSLIVMGNIGYGMRSSSLYKNIQISGFRKRDFYIPTILTIFALQILLSMFFWPTYWLLGKLGFIMCEFAIKGNSINIITPLTVIAITYLTFISTMTSFSFYFLFHSIVNTIKGYYYVVMSMLILGILFGGCINSYFSHPIGYNDVLTGYDSFGNSYHFASQQGRLFFTISSQETFSSSLLDESVYGFDMSAGLFPEKLFIPTLLNPFYGVGQFASSALNIVYNDEFSKNIHIIVPANIYDSYTAKDVYGKMLQVYNDGGAESLQTFMIDNNWVYVNPNPDGYNLSSLFGIGFDKYHLPWTLVLIQPFATTVAYFFIGKGIIYTKESL